MTTVVVDTSAQSPARAELNQQIRRSHVLLLVYADHYSYERIALFWMPHFRSLGVNVPVVLCANKADLTATTPTPQVVEEEMLPLLSEFKEIDSCIRTSAREKHNVNEAFFLCQKAVTHPIAPLFDSKEGMLKPAATKALQRIFYLCDKDQDGFLSDAELLAFQKKCFGKPLGDADLAYIKASLGDGVGEKGITEKGFLRLNKLFAEKGRHETVWIILRTFHYSDSLSLKESFLRPKFDVPSFASAELAPAGYQFLFDLFLLFDKDNDGGLNDSELATLFGPTPGLPPSWLETSFPSSTVRNEAGHITLQGWLAQWSMTTFSDPTTTLAYLAYFGFEPPDPSRQTTSAALKITKPRKRRRRPPAKVERNVVHAYVVGAPGAGKSAVLDSLLARPFSPTYHPTIQARTAVNAVELPGGKQVYLILEELGELEPAILDNTSKLDACDVVVYAYDSGDPDSFASIINLRAKHPALEELPALFVALKADQDRVTQRSEVQPDEYASRLGLNQPLHVSVTWESISELFVQIAEAALAPATALPKTDRDEKDHTNLYIAAGTAVCAGAVSIAVWRKVSAGN